MYKYRSLNSLSCWDKTKAAILRAVGVWSGSENISKADKGNMGTRESLRSPHVKKRHTVYRVNKRPGYTGNLLPLSNEKNKQQA
jgi:hypothetical protein